MLLSRLVKSTGSTTAALLILALLDGVQGKVPAYGNSTQGPTGWPPCDALIAGGMSHALTLPSSSFFTPLVDMNWNLDTRRAPWCFVSPNSVAEVVQTVNALRDAGEGAGDWHIAIRSGGHGSDNSNNIVDGVTIDLSRLNTTTYNNATNTASVGTGSRWQGVYNTLESQGVSVVGGREGVVGVGGFALGGGNSWYTARYGFTCDNVVNFEVVLASGEIVNANASANSDLWSALRGGGSNYGIVTRFDFEAFPAKNLSVTAQSIGFEHSDAFVDATYNFANLSPSFRDNALLLLGRYDTKTNATTMLVYQVNTANDGNSLAFDAFNRIPSLTPSTTISASVAKSADSDEVPEGSLNAGAYLTIANDPRVMRYAVAQHNKLVTDLKAAIGNKGFSTILDFQPLPSYFAQVSAQRGGNMLGLGQYKGNRVFYTAGITLTGPDKNAVFPLVSQMVQAMVGRVGVYAKSLGSLDGFVYMNYAHANQNPLGSYGAANVKHMKEVAAKYDPDAFFQTRVPGGFKIDRVS